MIIIIRSSRIIATRQPTRMEVLESSAFSPIQVLVTEDVVPAITQKENLELKHQRFSVPANFLQSGTEKILGSSLSINTTAAFTFCFYQKFSFWRLKELRIVQRTSAIQDCCKQNRFLQWMHPRADSAQGFPGST